MAYLTSNEMKKFWSIVGAFAFPAMIIVFGAVRIVGDWILSYIK